MLTYNTVIPIYQSILKKKMITVLTKILNSTAVLLCEMYLDTKMEVSLNMLKVLTQWFDLVGGQNSGT